MKSMILALVCLVLLPLSFAWQEDAVRRDPTQALPLAATASKPTGVPALPSAPRLELGGLVVAQGKPGHALVRVGEDWVRVWVGADLEAPGGWQARVESVDEQGVGLRESGGSLRILR
jgi:hypothetical protein